MSSEHPIEILTRTILSASEAGHWDQVACLYQRRSLEFVLRELPVRVIRRLIDMDTLIQERARVVHAATRQNLLQVQERRRKLLQWKQQWASSPVESGRFVRTA
ncbi:MAG: hypothetical protein MRJ96_13080 [Nitrospirales bacterium]|nr:hypothetical protein [Nitrospira sp.]MDR4502377.1 hypothetical protein [Nitrospirales bacterium]